MWKKVDIYRIDLTNIVKKTAAVVLKATKLEFNLATQKVKNLVSNQRVGVIAAWDVTETGP